MNAAKKVVDGANLPLAVAAFALEYRSIKIERIDNGSFEVRAWDRIGKSY